MRNRERIPTIVTGFKDFGEVLLEKKLELFEILANVRTFGIPADLAM